MNKHLPLIIATLALAAAARAESTARISDVHLCCKSCVTGVEKAVARVSGAKAACDADAKTVTITAPDAATAQKATDALVEAGYFGTCADGTVKLKDTSGAKDAKVSGLTVNDVHLCCKKCVTGVTKALEGVKGVTGNNAEKGSKSFRIEGEFNAKEAFTALQKHGYTGKAGN